jgi:hypothetical protein
LELSTVHSNATSRASDEMRSDEARHAAVAVDERVDHEEALEEQLDARG